MLVIPNQEQGRSVNSPNSCDGSRCSPFAKRIAPPKISHFCSRGLAKHSHHVFKPITTTHSTSFFDKVRHSARGPDGVPCVYWKATGYHGARSLFLVGFLMKSALRMPVCFFLNAIVFPPKGGFPDDEHDLLRVAGNTYPLSLTKMRQQYCMRRE